MPPQIKPKIGFIGLGLMGTPMALRVLAAGFDLSVWNRTKDKCKPLVMAGANFSILPKVLAQQSDMILLCVTDEFAVENILFGEDGIMAAQKLPRVIVDHSTISPIAAKKIGERVRCAGTFYIDAPVTGSVPGAENGTLSVFAGGQAEIIDEVKPVLAAYARRVTYMGANGSGQATKVCNQTMLHNAILSTFETINLAKRQGLDIDTLFAAFEESLFDSRAWQIFSRALFSVQGQKMAHIKDVMKDLNYICDVAKLTNSSIFLTQTIAELVRKLVNDGLGQSDVLEIMRLYKT